MAAIRIQRLWWVYVLFGLLCLGWGIFLAASGHPRIEAGLFAVIGLSNTAAGLIWRQQRPGVRGG